MERPAREHKTPRDMPLRPRKISKYPKSRFQRYRAGKIHLYSREHRNRVGIAISVLLREREGTCRRRDSLLANKIKIANIQATVFSVSLSRNNSNGKLRKVCCNTPASLRRIRVLSIIPRDHELVSLFARNIIYFLSLLCNHNIVNFLICHLPLPPANSVNFSTEIG